MRSSGTWHHSGTERTCLQLLRQVARNGVCRVLRMSFLTWLTSAYYSQNDESFGIIWRIVVGDWLNILNFFVFVKCCVYRHFSPVQLRAYGFVCLFLPAVYSYCFFLVFFADILLMRCVVSVLGFGVKVSFVTCRHTVLPAHFNFLPWSAPVS